MEMTVPPKDTRRAVLQEQERSVSGLWIEGRTVTGAFSEVLGRWHGRSHWP